MLNKNNYGSNTSNDKIISYPFSLTLREQKNVISSTHVRVPTGEYVNNDLRDGTLELGLNILKTQKSALKFLQTAAYLLKNKEHIIKLNLATPDSSSQQHSQIAIHNDENFKLMKAFIGKPLKSRAQNFYHSKAITYSFIQKNNNYPLLSSTKKIESLLIEFFLSLSSLIGRPVFINFQNKLVIRLFVFTPLMRSGTLLHRKSANTNLLHKSVNRKNRNRRGNLRDRSRISLLFQNSKNMNLFIEKFS
jgi:hypothetical protein